MPRRKDEIINATILGVSIGSAYGFFIFGFILYYIYGNQLSQGGLVVMLTGPLAAVAGGILGLLYVYIPRWIVAILAVISLTVITYIGLVEVGYYKF